MKSKNLKVYKKIDGEKKYKVSKIKKAVITVGLSISILSAGIYGVYYFNEQKRLEELAEQYANEYEYYESYYVDNDSMPEFEVATGQDEPKKETYEDKILINENDAINFNNYLETLKFKYKYEDLYGIDNAFNLYKENENSSYNVKKHSHDIRSDGFTLTVDDLYNTVIQNNKIEKKVNYGLENSFFDKLSKTEIRNVCEIIVDYINKAVEEDPNLDMDKISCSLYDLQIFSDPSSMANAYLDQYNRLIINNKNIENYQGLNSDVDAYRQVVVHETQHIIQNACSDMEKNNEHEIGNSYQFSNLKINPLYNSWLLEASAELEMSNLLDEEPNTYSSQISYFESLMLCGMLNQNVKLEDIQKLTFNKNSSELYRVFNAKTEEEQKEINKLLYSVEIMQSQDANFYDLYDSTYGTNLMLDEQAVADLNQDLRLDILKSLTIKFYSSLTSCIQNNNMTLNDIMYFINIYEADVYVHLYYSETDRIVTSGEFFEFYTGVQNEFFEMISKNIKYNTNDMIDILNNYSMYTTNEKGEVIENFNIGYLDNDEQVFLRYYQAKNYKTGIPTIQYMKDYYNENYKK